MITPPAIIVGRFDELYNKFVNSQGYKVFECDKSWVYCDTLDIPVGTNAVVFAFREKPDNLSGIDTIMHEGYNSYPVILLLRFDWISQTSTYVKYCGNFQKFATKPTIEEYDNISKWKEDKEKNISTAVKHCRKHLPVIMELENNKIPCKGKVLEMICTENKL